MLKHLLFVGMGGASGSILRYLVQKWMLHFYPHSFPIGTFVVNITGCFLIGLFYGLIPNNTAAGIDLRFLLMTGFCGGFTTFSAFTLEGMSLLGSDRFLSFFLYFTLSIVLGLSATFIGAMITR